MHFKAAGLDGMSRILTPLTIVIALALMISPTIVGPDGDLAGRLTQLVGLALLLIAAVSWAAMPSGFDVEDEGFLIATGLGGSRLPWDTVEGARPITKGETPVLRVFGGGGLFGHWGLFRGREGGTVMVRATRRYPAVRVARAGKRALLLSPEDPEGLSAAINARAAAQ